MTLLKELARIILIFVRKKVHVNESHHFTEGYKTRNFDIARFIEQYREPRNLEFACVINLFEMCGCYLRVL